MKLFSTLLLTLAAGAAATSSTPKVVRTANKGVESSRQLQGQGTGNNSNPNNNANRPSNYGGYTSYGYSSSSSGGSSSSSKPHPKKPPAKKTKKPKAKPHPKKPSKPSSSHSSSSGYSSYSSGYGYDSSANTTTYSAVGALALVGVAATVLAKKVSSRG